MNLVFHWRILAPEEIVAVVVINSPLPLLFPLPPIVSFFIILYYQ